MLNIEKLSSQANTLADRVSETMSVQACDLKIPGLSEEEANGRNSLDEKFFGDILNLKHLKKYKKA